MKLSEVVAEKAKAEIQVGGGTISFTFYPLYRKRFSEDEWNDILASRGIDEIRKFLPRVLLSWDLTDDEGHAIPITSEAFDQFEIPEELLREIERRVLGSDLAGKARTSNNSLGI